jgi:23S rRNA pseudouridine1911/1915/1917 synthase
MIVHVDERLLVIDKPSGVPSVPLGKDADDKNRAPTAVDLILREFPAQTGVGRDVGKPLEAGLLHRLDTGTSGLLAFARDAETYEKLKALWKTTAVTKTYRALVSGEPPFPKLPLVIEQPLGHSAKSSKRMLVVLPGREQSIRGKPLPARTELIGASRIEYGACLRQMYDIEVTIRTGVMHQIRCHLSAQGWPVLGDPVYKGDTSERLWLHAWKLALPGLELEAPLPKGWPAKEAHVS